MATILKYTLDPVHGGRFEMPEQARFLALQVQNDEPVMWFNCVVGPLPYRTVEREFVVLTTGQEHGELAYIGTFQVPDDPPPAIFVGHVFERQPRRPFP